MSTPATIVVIGAGFAGLWAALGAAYKLDDAKTENGAFRIALIAPEPTLYVRPRLYEADVSPAKADLTAVLDAVGIQYIQGTVHRIATDGDVVEYTSRDGTSHSLRYDRLILASGSRLFRPPIPGLAQYALSVDQYDEAEALHKHLKALASLPDSPARNTVVVCGGGLTGIETATEMPARLREILGEDANIRVVMVDRGKEVGLGPNPRPVIAEALSSLNVEVVTSESVATIDSEGITTASGLRILSKTVIWTAGLRASQLTEQVPGEKDSFGRLVVDDDLRVPGLKKVFAAGDTGLAAADDKGNRTVMSCQHALVLGRFAGYNAAADLLGLPPKPYRQELYATCVDLGAWGGLFTLGWERDVLFTKGQGKDMKVNINTKMIYPPPADRATALAEANPEKALEALNAFAL